MTTEPDIEPTGEQVLAWIDAHADELPPLTDWQRDLIKAWFDGYVVLTPRLNGRITMRHVASTARRALIAQRAGQPQKDHAH